MYMTILVCDCNATRACTMHADELYSSQPTPVDTADTERRSFEDASADFHIPGWTPADVDEREHDRKILADMTAEAHDNPDMAHARSALQSHTRIVINEPALKHGRQGVSFLQ